MADVQIVTIYILRAEYTLMYIPFIQTSGTYVVYEKYVHH